MAETEHHKPFWNTVPGILAGLAAIITAVGGLYVAMRGGGTEGSQPALLTASPSSEPAPGAATPAEWPVLAEETFTSPATRWQTGSFPMEQNARFETDVIAGNYRWDFEFLQPWYQFIEAPYGPVTDFYVAVDVEFVANSSEAPFAAGLIFGRSAGSHYALDLASNGYYTLARVGDQEGGVISWIPVHLNEQGPNRIAVTVQQGQIELAVNDSFVGAYKDASFTGGVVGLTVSTWEPKSAVVDFDNFEFRRKP